MKNNIHKSSRRGIYSFIAIFLTLLFFSGYSSLMGQNTIYVNLAAGGANNGSSWTDAYTDLQAALDNATTKGDQIWVAAGIYKPSKDKSGNDSPDDNRTKTFQLIDSVFLFGGFNGTESTLDERDWETNETILSGDLGTQDDTSDNSYYVVKGITNGYIDGFIVEGGNGNGSSPNNMGGGIQIGDPDGGTPPPVRLKNMKVIHCILRDNRSAQGGGAAAFYCGDSIVFRYCTFIDNTGGSGAGLGNWDTKAYVTGCLFVDNVTDEDFPGSHWGGGIYNWGSGSKAEIINCTFIGNSSDQGGGIHDRGVGAGGHVKNCIFWKNNPNDLYPDGSITYNFTNQPGYTGINGNIGGNPLLYEMGVGEYELNWASPCIDAGDPDPSYNDPDGSRNDMGTHHSIFSPSVDALISVIDTPLLSTILGEYDIWGKMVNLGTDPLTAVDVDWEVDGTPQTTYHWTGNLSGGDTTESFIIGSYTFNQGNHSIKSWTSIISDEFHENDTVLKEIYAFAQMDAGVVSLDNPDTLFTNEPLTSILISLKNFDTDSTIKTIDIGWSVDGTPQTPYNWSGNLLPEETIDSVNIGSYSFSRGKHLLKVWPEKPNGFDYDDNNENDTLALNVYSRILDIGISALFKPTDPDTSGLHTVLVAITNYSTDNTITKATVDWEADGTPQDSYIWTGSLPPGESTDSIEIGTYNLPSTGTYEFTIWTESPNDDQDDYHGNDTLHATINIDYPLSGTYTIGPSDCDFETFTDAVDSLVNGGGIGGPVTFLVSPGIYTEQITIPEIYGSSAERTITFRPASGDSTAVTLTNTGGGSTLTLESADGIIFKKMTISTDAAGSAIALRNGAEHNQFLNNQILGESGSPNLVSFYSSSSIKQNRDNLFEKNRLVNGSDGIYLYRYCTGTEIRDNVLLDQTGYPVRLQEIHGATISGNNITTNSTVKAIYLEYCEDNFIIEKNNIVLTGGGSGIYFYRGKNNTGIPDLIANNFISINTSDKQYGIYYDYDYRDMDIIHNSILIKGSSNNSDAINIVSQYPTVNIINNILVNKTGGRAIYTDQQYRNKTSDYNCLYVTGSYIINNIQLLAQQQKSNGQDMHSLSIDPWFITDGNLHTFEPHMNNRGTPIADISTDIDGEERNAEHPDIGADEFDPLPPLTGTFELGPSASIFKTFNEAVDSLIKVGAGGPVIFEVEDGTYDEQVVIPWIAGANETNTITFKSAGKDSTKVTLTHAATGETDNYTLKLDGARYITFQDMTLEATGAEYARIVEIGNQTYNNSFNNNQFLGILNKSELIYSYFYYYAGLDSCNHFYNNLFQNGIEGIHMEGTGTNTGLEIVGNTFHDQTNQAISLNKYTGPVIKSNIIHSEYKITGIYLYYTYEYAIVGNNLIHLNAGGTGVEMEHGSWGTLNDTSLIYNNYIYLEEDPAYGIFLNYNSLGSKIVFNTIHLTGNNASGACFYATQNEYKCLKNNIMVNKASGKVLYLESLGGLFSDYNNLYTNGTHFAKYNAGLKDWQEDYGRDLNSFSVDPYFENDSSYRPLNPYLKGAGIPVPPVLTDIDGESRDAVHPDIGADEFTVCNTPISGTFTIGGTTPNYETLYDAVKKLVCCGVDGAVTFNIAADTIDGQISIQEIPGASETNTITFQSLSGDSTDVLITFTPVNTALPYTVQMNGADYVIFKSLSFTSGEQWGHPIELTNMATHNKFLNNRIYYKGTMAENDDYALIYSKESLDSNNVFDSNLFENGSIGILMDGSGTADSISGTQIKNNTFNGMIRRGVYLTNHEDFVISGNQFSILTSGFNFGICIVSSKGLIYNNFIHLETTSYGRGIFLSGSDYSVYHNTVKITGNSPSYADALWFNGNNTRLVNNVFTNMAGGRAMRCDTNDLVSDYNLLYTSGTILVTKYTGSYNYSDLNQWQDATGRDVHSVSRKPVFVSDTNLHTTDPWLNNIGTPLAEVTADIDGESRDPVHPDLGADEFEGLMPFGGEYTIGPTGDFATFKKAVDTIAPVGIKEPITFIVESGTYNEQFEIPYIPEVSETRTVSFKPASGDSMDVTLEFKATADENYLVKLDSAMYITFENMTFKALDTAYANIVEFTNGASYNVFSNSIFEGDNEKGQIFYSSGSQDNNNLIENNLITGGNVGIYMLGESESLLESGLEIKDNQFNDQYSAAIYLKYQHAPVISNNRISHVEPVKYQWAGIFLTHCTGQYDNYGLTANNTIAIHAETESAGIVADAVSYHRIYYNSVNIYGNAAESRSFNQQNTGHHIEVTNNIFSNQAEGVVIYTTDLNAYTSDYNDYYASGSNFIYYDNFIPDLQTWQSTYSKDLNSYAVDPMFYADTNLHVSQSLLNGSGTPLAEVVKDMDGETRDPVRPDIGADEFTEAIFTMIAKDTTICLNSQIEIDAGPGFDSYLWNTGETTQSITIDNFDLASAYFRVEVTHNTYTYQDSVKVTSYPLPDVSIIREEDNLSIDDPSIVAYQWYFDNTLIDGATASDYSPTQSGDFFVIVTDGNGCSNTSDTVAFWMTLIENVNQPDNVEIYPNPATGYIHVRITGISSPVKLFIVNSAGSVVHTEEMKDPAHQSETRIDLSGLPEGLYFVVIQTEHQRIMKKVVVE